MIETCHGTDASTGCRERSAGARTDGRTAWQTDLPNEKPETDEYRDVAVVVSGHWFAARVNDRRYAGDLRKRK